MSLQRRDFIKLSTAAAASAWMSTSCQ
ncbi:MAG: twin-arginine translocation signal domain-containing protein, partial [Candidatus Aminicenantes bacterium]|nr:twin-arginine translocation signal domain-containing protein [Candidatus Aminicenantes bacterium]